MTTATRLFSFGDRPHNGHRMTHAQAREFARGQPSTGYVWMFLARQRHWAIVATFDDGSVWNGQARIVPCKPNPADDWEGSAAHR